MVLHINYNQFPNLDTMNHHDHDMGMIVHSTWALYQTKKGGADVINKHFTFAIAAFNSSSSSSDHAAALPPPKAC
eukprot:scaffold67383_cov51-Attheya_sp.AAC.2